LDEHFLTELVQKHLKKQQSKEPGHFEKKNEQNRTTGPTRGAQTIFTKLPKLLQQLLGRAVAQGLQFRAFQFGLTEQAPQV
jgi:hypothetical protein